MGGRVGSRERLKGGVPIRGGGEGGGSQSEAYEDCPTARGRAHSSRDRQGDHNEDDRWAVKCQAEGCCGQGGKGGHGTWQ